MRLNYRHLYQYLSMILPLFNKKDGFFEIKSTQGIRLNFIGP